MRFLIINYLIQTYSLVRRNWSSDVTRCMQLRCIQRTSENQFHCTRLYIQTNFQLPREPITFPFDTTLTIRANWRWRYASKYFGKATSKPSPFHVRKAAHYNALTSACSFLTTTIIQERTVGRPHLDKSPESLDNVLLLSTYRFGTTQLSVQE